MTETNRKPRAVKIPKAVTRAILRTLLVVFTLVLLVLFGLIMVLDHAFNGPSMTARELLTMSMLESSGMKWTPAIFIGADTVEAIKEKVSKPFVKLKDTLPILTKILLTSIGIMREIM
jgi:hypothetical protein